MNLLTGVNNALMFINEHWTEITIMVALIYALVKKVKDFMNKSDDEKAEIALWQAKEIILDYVTKAEFDYAEWKKSGAIKRAQVLDEIFEKYPILSKVTNQDAIITKLDGYIDDALVSMREVLSDNNGDNAA